MRAAEIVSAIATGDSIVDGMGRGGIASTGLGLLGVITTANLQYYALVVAGAGTLAVQLWWEWYRQARRSRIESADVQRRAWVKREADKAREKKRLQDEGIDTATWPAFNPSPDPDSETHP
jgi:hypothetical protein